MLAKAVQQHQLNPAQGHVKIAQQSLPSPPTSSFTARKEFPREGTRQYISHPIKRQATATHNVLKALPPSALNGVPQERRVGPYKPLKRTVSQATAMSTVSSRQDSVFSNNNTIGLAQPLPGTERVGKLHEAVYFDENDFDDDAELNFELEQSRAKGDLSPSTPNRHSSKQNDNVAVTSSVPIPWSSSPLQHQATPPNAAFLRRTTNAPAIDSLQTTQRFDSLQTQGSSQDPLYRPAQRRTLPWIRDGRQEMAEEPRRKAPPHLSETIDRKRRRENYNQNDLEDEGGSVTSLPKSKVNSPYPWNKTASAVKEEQKRLRQANKKPLKSVEPHGDHKKNLRGSKKQDVARIFLSDEQRKVIDLVVEQQKSVFFTGSAGTGKSVLMRELIKALRDKHKREPDRVAVTASTGLAACNVGGVTLHSFGGIGLGKEEVPELVRKIKKNRKAKDRWMRTKTLIIDEISMVDGDLFDKLEAVARTIRNNGRPFGGIQLVITGDFFQLPPVPDYGKIAKFAFDAHTWSTSIHRTIGLSQVFRQRDPDFANMLNEMRLGRLTEKSINTFRALNRPLSFDDEIEATELFPTRQEVDNANNTRMRNLHGTAMDFKALDGGMMTDIAQRDKLLSNCMAPPLITLKKGSQVMMIKNHDESIVNGTLGKVVNFMDEKTYTYYQEHEDDFDTPESSNGDMEESKRKLQAMAGPGLISSTSQKWPVVRFTLADGTMRDLCCEPETWKIELPNGEVQASRSQVPLILAWALSIHKAQGQTLDRVKVDLGRIFEKGQAYVALSRATCQEGLQVLRFDPKKVMAHEKVRAFYNTLYNVSSLGSRVPEVSKDQGRSSLQAKEPFDDDDDLQELFM